MGGDGLANPSSETPLIRSGKEKIPALLVFLPVLVQVGLVFRGIQNWVPVWAWYPDPGYQYLLAGASLVSGGAPALVYHPGTSFQWLVGIVELVHHSLIGSGSFFTDLVASPEEYARSIGTAVALVFAAALLFVAWTMLRNLGPWPALVFQLMMLWGLPVIAGARFHLWPESLVLACTLVTIGLLTRPWKLGSAALPLPSAILLGVVGAIGISAKVIYLPIVLVVAACLTWRRNLVYFASFALTSILIVAPIISRLPKMWEWFSSIATTSGRHGQVVETSTVDNVLAANGVLGGFLRWYVPVVLILGVALVGLVARKRTIKDPLVRGALAVSLGIAAVVVSTAKQSEIRDLIAIVPLIAALSAVLFTSALGMVSMKNARRGVVGGVLAFTGFLALHGFVHANNFATFERQEVDVVVRDAESVMAGISGGRWGLGYNVWTEQNALMFGSNDGLMLGVEYSDDLVNREISERFPTALYFDLWSRNFQEIGDDFRLGVVSCQQLSDYLSAGPVGIVVESPGHVTLDREGNEIVLSDGRASFTGPVGIGEYSAYEFTVLRCDE